MAQPPRPITDMLPMVVNNVLVATGKAFKTAKRDGPASSASHAYETRIPLEFERFNAILDEVESEFLMAKAVLERDLRQLKAKRQPPPESQPVAPPAPMGVEPDVTNSSKTGSFGPSSATPQPGAQPSKPAAPFPNMGVDTTSPQATAKPNPAAPSVQRNVMNSGQPTMAAAAAAAAKPASALPRKDAKPPTPQIQRPNSVAGNPQATAKPPLGPPTNRPASQGPPGVTPTPVGNENLFTGMAFSLAPSSNDTQAPTQAGQPQRRPSQQLQKQQPAAPMVAGAGQGAGNAPGANAEPKPAAGSANAAASSGAAAEPGKPVVDRSMSSDFDDKIDDLFNLGGSGDMDNMNLSYDLGNSDNSNFNDMYFASGDSGGGSGDFDDAFFNLNG
ncbi:hypothetical protein VTJ83DRAFT_1277 [Remersonia thermophila]|uniref:Uncharacterized protein n=1 Tax=Remersonia thermophila TaxID=72144 RepID=A0ABR4DNK0_9PEZI